MPLQYVVTTVIPFLKLNLKAPESHGRQSHKAVQQPIDRTTTISLVRNSAKGCLEDLQIPRV